MGGAVRRTRLAVLLVVLGICLAGVAIVVVGLTREDPRQADVRAVRAAGRSLTGATGLSLSGTYDESRATFTVTHAGTARGTYRSAGGPVSRIDVDSTTYLKAASRFWTDHGRPAAVGAVAAGHWAKAPDGFADLSLSSLAPQQLGQNLLEPGTSLPVRTQLGRVRAIRLSAAGLTYFVSRATPHRVLRVQGRTLRYAYSFDVAALAPASVDTFFTGLRTDVAALKDAYNPNLYFQPGGRARFGGCDASGCTVSGTVEPDAFGGSGSIHLRATVEFRGAAGVVSRCTDSALTTSQLRVTYRCRTSGHAWTSWYVSHNGRFLITAHPTFTATVNSAQDITHLLLVLDQEQQRTS